MKNVNKEKGSITLYVLISMLFFVVVLVSMYTSVQNRMQMQEKEINKIQETYTKQDINDIYNEQYEYKINNEI